MTLFDQLVDVALSRQSDLATLRPVVEKELLHHDILREMSEAGLLAGLTFMGGTCLRACYGANRLSEDLDFTGGAEFTQKQLSGLAQVLQKRLQGKYGLNLSVSDPRRDSGRVSTWKIQVQTQSDRPDLPSQRIHIDICAIPSYDKKPMMLRNSYGVDMGTSGLIIQAQSREEILLDKVLAFALRPNRLKNRDLWDMVWLNQQGVAVDWRHLRDKLGDHACSEPEFLRLVTERSQLLRGQPSLRDDFVQEMRRFLPGSLVRSTVEQPAFWQFLVDRVGLQCQGAVDYLSGAYDPPLFRM